MRCHAAIEIETFFTERGKAAYSREFGRTLRIPLHPSTFEGPVPHHSDGSPWSAVTTSADDFASAELDLIEVSGQQFLFADCAIECPVWFG